MKENAQFEKNNARLSVNRAKDASWRSFEAETAGAIRALVELLASDEDMLGLLVSERLAQKNRAVGQNGAEGPATLPLERHAVVELLLESYLRRLVRVGFNIATAPRGLLCGRLSERKEGHRRLSLL